MGSCSVWKLILIKKHNINDIDSILFSYEGYTNYGNSYSPSMSMISVIMQVL